MALLELILTILQNIIKTDITEPKVLHTCVFCVGRYCDWMNKYAPQFAIEAFKYILKHLQNPQLFETASVTFEMIFLLHEQKFNKMIKKTINFFITFI